MPTPTSFSNVNVELNYASNTAITIDDPIVRALTGNTAEATPESPIAFGDLAGKVAFDGVLIGPLSVSNSGFGSCNAVANFSIVSDLVGANVVWTATNITGNVATFTSNGLTASLALNSNSIGSFSSNTQLSVTMSYGAHTIGSNTSYVNLSTQVFDPNVVVSGTLTVNSTGFAAQTATTTLTATSNVPGGVMHFSASPSTGWTVSGNTITFTTSAPNVNDDIDQPWTLTTSVLQNGVAVGSNTCTVDLHAIYFGTNFTFGVPSTSNNVFANSGSVTSSLSLTADHNQPSSNIVWSATKVSGSNATLIVSANNQSANLWLNIPSGTFDTRKAVYTITAKLVDSSNNVLSSNSATVTLRAGAYGLTYTPAANVTASGYTAQTASSTATASWNAGSFNWFYSTISGVTSTSNTLIANTSSFTVNTSTSVVGSNNASYVLNPVLTYDGVVMANVVTSNVALLAQQNSYSFSISGATVNTQIGAPPVNTSITTTATQNIVGGTIQWSQDNSNLTLTTNAISGTANVSLSANSITTNYSANLSCTLLDASSRVVEIKKVVLTLRTFIPNLVVLGSNSVSVSSYLPNTAATTISASFNAGANLVTQVINTTTGTTFAQGTQTSNSTFIATPMSLSTSGTAYGTNTGLSSVVTTLTYFDKTISNTYPINLSATLIDPAFSVAVANGSISSFVPSEVVANTTITASHTVPGGYCSFAVSANSGGVTNWTANTSVAYWNEMTNTVGTNTGLLTASCTLFNSNNELVKQITGISTQAVATLLDPQLTLTGTTSNVTSNLFSCTVSSLLTAASNASIVTPTYVFSEIKNSGNASFITNTTQVQGTCTASGAVTNACNYTASVTLYSNGQYVANTSAVVNLSATGTKPVYSISGPDASVGDFNYPVSASSICTVANLSGGYAAWSASLVSGTAASGTQSGTGNNTFTIGKTMSNIGSNTSNYNVSVSCYSPDGILMDTLTSNGVVTTAQRYDPGFSFTAGANVSLVGWSTLTANVAVSATSNASLTGETYSLTYVVNAGSPSVSNSATGSGWASVVGTANSTSSNTATVTFTCSVSKGGQILAGPFSKTVKVTATPYYVDYIISGNPTGVSSANQQAQMRSNHPAFTLVNWASTRSGAGNVSIFTTSVANDTIEISNSSSGPEWSGTLSANGYFTANGAVRTTGFISLSADATGTL